MNTKRKCKFFPPHSNDILNNARGENLIMKESTRRRIKTIKKVSVIIGALVIPLMYSYFYLGAFWDPYSKLDSVPVAIVNEDAGAVINGTERNAGRELCDKLKDDGSLDFSFVSAKKADAGVSGNKYYASITIPKDFSQDIASAATTDKTTAQLVYHVNEKRNYIASQILNNAKAKIQKELTGELDQQIVLTLANKVKTVPDELSTLSAGLHQMDSGASQLQNGSGQLVAGTDKLNAGGKTLASGTSSALSGSDSLALGTTKLAAGAKTLAAGSSSLASGAKDLDDGLARLLAGVNTMESKMPALASQTSQLNQGAQTLSAGVSKYVTSTNNTIDSIDTNITNASALMNTKSTDAEKLAVAQATLKGIQDGLKATDPQTGKTLRESGASLTAGAQTVASGTSQLAAGTAAGSELRTGLDAIQQGASDAKTGSAKIKSGADSVSAGASSVSDASAQVAAGASTLNDGLRTLDGGAAQLSMGLSKLAKSQKTMDSGITELASGISTGTKSVDSGLKSAKTQVSALDGLSDYAKEPVKVKTDTVYSVPNYGTAFAPYFMSLSLWVGGLIIFFGIYYDVDKRYKYLCRDSENKVIRTFSYLVLALAQALLLAFLVKAALGLSVDNFGAYIAACCFVSVVFIAIIQFFIVELGDLGKFLSLLLLILQLTSCGGTFPMETVPSFFRHLYPFMPMTYSVGLFKETISGNVGTSMKMNIIVLGMYLAAALIATILMIVMKKGARELRKSRKIAARAQRPELGV